MEQYSPMDPYARSRYEQGIDSKIVIMGNSGVGKTSLLQRYTQNKFDPKNTTSTSGAFFVSKKASTNPPGDRPRKTKPLQVYVNGLKVRLQLWDTAGQERFRSMAPMYYRGANAALLLYDITNASTFDDIRGWLEELKKNCQPDLIIYIVGSKADLSPHRQVTSDLARLSLHNWFPPPRPPTPPPPPQPSTLSYIRPRFTSFPGLRSPPTSPPTRTPPETPAYLDLQANRSSALTRSNTAQSRPQPTTAGSSRSNVSSTARPQQQSRFGSHFGIQAGGWSELHDSSTNSLNEDDEHAVEDDEEEEREWGLSKGMELFEVSAKDDLGIQNLFDHLISAIIVRKDRIERENELKKRDSVFLTSVAAPAWTAQAEEEEAREKAERERSARGWSLLLSESAQDALHSSVSTPPRFLIPAGCPVPPSFPTRTHPPFLYCTISIYSTLAPHFAPLRFHSIITPALLHHHDHASSRSSPAISISIHVSLSLVSSHISSHDHSSSPYPQYASFTSVFASLIRLLLSTLSAHYYATLRRGVYMPIV
ncbi:P-loop containing nucleoside triphosphate hydrolase protein [Mycena vulgaris]|nr:P-loop containing nucleoside triphosphate hydrolase protein [Mycena vulgaris]